MLNIGIIGTGAMGYPIALNMNRFYNISFYARRENIIKNLTSNGLKYNTIKELANNQEIIFLFVRTYDQCNECIEELILNNFAGILIIGSTISPNEMEMIDKKCNKKNILTLAMPVTGGVIGAKNGTLTLFVSGKRTVIEKASEILTSFAKEIIYLGEDIKSAHVMKALVQFLVSVNTIATSEALILGLKMGLNGQDIYKTIINSAGSSNIFKNRVPTILENNFNKRGSIDILKKDINIVNDLMMETETIMILPPICLNLFNIANNILNKEEDFSSLIKLYKEWNKFK